MRFLVYYIHVIKCPLETKCTMNPNVVTPITKRVESHYAAVLDMICIHHSVSLTLVEKEP